jgi:dihydroorotate dehydrogenase
MYRYLIKPFMFLLDPEKAHHLTILLLKAALSLPGGRWIFDQLYSVKDPRLERKIMGLTFPNPVGLAAGFDKDGKYYEDMAALGFGFIEIGTVTPLPQAGNDKPRLFRLPSDRALINRMGFNNDGVDAMVKRLKNRNKTQLIIGGNIGKNKITPNENAVDDYMKCFEALYDHVDYFVVNVSSPNTPGLRALQEKGPLTDILSTLMIANTKKSNPKPILLKIAPDLTDSQLDDIIEIVKTTQIAGVIATNTTLDRSMITTPTEHIGAGGLSGHPVKKRSTEVISYLHQKSQGAFVIIGVGGIESAQDALEKLEAGASLVQVYTGMVYTGPGLIRDINKAIGKVR